MAIQPAVFVGLGGAGVTTVGHLKAKMLERLGSEEVGRSVRFLFIDTDEGAKKAIDDQYSGLARQQAGGSLITAAEWVDLGGVNPYQAWFTNQARFRWVHPKAAQQFQNSPLRDGAGANRQQGRVAFGHVGTNFVDRVRQALGAIGALKNQWVGDFLPAFYIVTGTCGGTGSSIFLDVAFVLNRIWQSRAIGNPRVRAVLFMPEFYIQQYTGLLQDRYRLNAYAFMVEIDKVLQQSTSSPPLFHDCAAIQVSSEAPWPVFDFAFCVDHRTEGGFMFSQDEMYTNTAEWLYWWHVGYSLRSKLMSAIDNEIQSLRGNERRLFAVIGYRALQYPRPLLQEYLRSRVLYELFDGLMGKPYEEALPHEDRRRDEERRIFRECIGRYLLGAQAQTDIPNLERDQTQKFQTRLQMLTIDIFRDDRGRVDADKVGDPTVIAQFEQIAQALSDQILNELERRFRQDPDSPIHVDRLRRYIQAGWEKEDRGSLNDEVERSILQFGLRYTIDLIEHLDVMCAEELNTPDREDDIFDRLAKVNEEIQRLEREREEAVKECLEARNRKKAEEAVSRLHSVWTQLIQKRAEKTILSQQKDVLAWLCQSGLLDRYMERLQKLRQAVYERLGEFERQYKVDLPKRFLAMRDDVTVTYLPDVASFVQHGSWKADHEFVPLYEAIVPQETIPGRGKEPKRYGPDYGFAPARGGLHGILEQLLQRDFAEDGKIRFFQGFFREVDRRWDTPYGLLSELENRVRQWVEEQMNQNYQIQKALEKSISDRFGELSPEDRQRVQNQFTTGLQGFCQMHPGARPESQERRIFVGHDRDLAKKLGFDEGAEQEGSHQFVPSEDKSRFMVIKFVLGYRIQDYANYREYERLKDLLEPTHTICWDMLHGVSEEELRRLFVRILIYRELIEWVQRQDPNLLDSVFYLNPAYVGSQQTMATPFWIDDQRNAWVLAVPPAQVNGRLHLPRGHFILLTSRPGDFSRIFADLRGHPQSGRIIEALHAFEREFQGRVHAGWSPHLDGVIGEFLDRKVRPGLSISDASVREFYQHINNITVEERETLRQKMMRTQAPPVSPTGPAPSPPEELLPI